MCGLDGHPPEWFIRENLRGLSTSELGASAAKNHFLVAAATSHGELNLRSYDNSGPTFLPADLVSTDLEYDIELREAETYRILDFDHIFRGQLDFKSQTIIEKMWLLHGHIHKAFRPP